MWRCDKNHDVHKKPLPQAAGGSKMRQETLVKMRCDLTRVFSYTTIKVNNLRHSRRYARSQYSLCSQSSGQSCTVRRTVGCAQ